MNFKSGIVSATLWAMLATSARTVTVTTGLVHVRDAINGRSGLIVVALGLETRIPLSMETSFSVQIKVGKGCNGVRGS